VSWQLIASLTHEREFQSFDWQRPQKTEKPKKRETVLLETGLVKTTMNKEKTDGSVPQRHNSCRLLEE
jgi:hypothetical protein